MRQSVIFPFGAALVLALSSACGNGSGIAERSAASDSAAASGEAGPLQHERAFAFSTTGEEDPALVPFLFDARTGPEGVERRVEGWIGRDGAWERFVGRDRAGPDGTPAWRILPEGPVRLLVGEGDAIEMITYDAPPRRLELDLQTTLAEWPGSRGGTYRLEEATLRIGDTERAGIVLDLQRSWETARPAGDWVFVVSGDSLQAVIHRPAPRSDGPEEPHAALVRVDFRNLQWPDVTVAWSDERPYDPARRRVPTAWRIRTESGEIEGELRAVSAELDVRDGEGPQLPVRGLFEVEGSLRVEGVVYPVRGLVRHRQE